MTEYEIAMSIVVILLFLIWWFSLGAISKLAGIVKDHLAWHDQNKQ